MQNQFLPDDQVDPGANRAFEPWLFYADFLWPERQRSNPERPRRIARTNDDPVSKLFTVMTAPLTRPPVGSATVPEIAAVTCANTGAAQSASAANSVALIGGLYS